MACFLLKNFTRRVVNPQKQDDLKIFTDDLWFQNAVSTNIFNDRPSLGRPAGLLEILKALEGKCDVECNNEYGLTFAATLNFNALLFCFYFYVQPLEIVA